MNPTLKKAKGFKPQFLFFDKSRENHLISESRSLEKELNQTAEAANKFFERPLSKEEMITIVQGGETAYLNLLREQIKFPKATKEAALGLLGKNDNELSAALKKLGVKPKYKLDEYEYNKGRFFIKDDTLKSFKDLATHYTKSEDQNEVLTIVKNTCENLNKCLDKSIINHPRGFDIVDLGNSLKKYIRQIHIDEIDSSKLKYTTQRKIKFEPDYEAILRYSNEN